MKKETKRERKMKRRAYYWDYGPLRAKQDEIYHQLSASLIRLLIKEEIKESQPLSKAMTRLLKAYLRVELTGMKEDFDAGYLRPYRYTNVL
jgi:hypothetical protein